LASSTYRAMMLVEKCPPPTLSCISYRITEISSSCKHRCKIWSCPCLYNFPSMVNGNTFNINLSCCPMEYPFGIFLVEMHVCTSYSHSSWSTNNDALVVLSCTLGSLVASRSHKRTFATKWKHLGLYTIEKLYSTNNNNHFVIWHNNWGFLTMYIKAMWSTL
jgi:hypothetical protein